MEAFFIIYLYPALLIGVVLSSILIGIRYPQARWWNTLLRCGAVVLCFFPLQVALGLATKGSTLPDHQLPDLSFITGILALVFCLPELIVLIVARCKFLIRVLKRLMGKNAPPPARGIHLGISPLWLLTPVGTLLLSMKAQTDRHTEMLLRGFSFALWCIPGLWILAIFFPIETKADFYVWTDAELCLRAVGFGYFLLLPELVRGVTSRRHE